MGKILSLGVSEEMIARAEAELAVRFPDTLRSAWMQYNCNELRGGWRVFPIFDADNPRKTAGSVVYENLKGVWGQEVMAQGLVSIADNGTGNQLVLKLTAGQAGQQIYHWSHETRKLTAWKPGPPAILAAAEKSRAQVVQLQQRFAPAPPAAAG